MITWLTNFRPNNTSFSRRFQTACIPFSYFFAKYFITQIPSSSPVYPVLLCSSSQTHFPTLYCTHSFTLSSTRTTVHTTQPRSDLYLVYILPCQTNARYFVCSQHFLFVKTLRSDPFKLPAQSTIRSQSSWLYIYKYNYRLIDCANTYLTCHLELKRIKTRVHCLPHSCNRTQTAYTHFSAPSICLTASIFSDDPTNHRISNPDRLLLPCLSCRRHYSPFRWPPAPSNVQHPLSGPTKIFAKHHKKNPIRASFFADRESALQFASRPLELKITLNLDDNLLEIVLWWCSNWLLCIITIICNSSLAIFDTRPDYH